MEAVKILLWLSEGYPNEKISQQTLLVYGEALADCNEADLKQAAVNLLRVKNNFPSVAEIVQEVEEIRASSLAAETTA